MEESSGPIIIKRKAGNVISTRIELLTNQWRLLDEYSKRFSQPKSVIVGQALQIWFNMVEKENRTDGMD